MLFCGPLRGPSGAFQRLDSEVVASLPHDGFASIPTRLSVVPDSTGGDLLLAVYLPARMRNTVVRPHHHWDLLSRVSTVRI